MTSSFTTSDRNRLAERLREPLTTNIRNALWQIFVEENMQQEANVFGDVYLVPDAITLCRRLHDMAVPRRIVREALVRANLTDLADLVFT
jgi:hypothetical protein